MALPAAGIDDPACAFFSSAGPSRRMEKTPRYVDGNTRDPRNPPDPDIEPKPAKGSKEAQGEA